MSQNSSIALDYNSFPGGLESTDNLNIPDFKSTDDGAKAWKYYDSDHTSAYNKVVSFQFQNQVPGDDDPLNYRTWYMETSTIGANMGLIVSCKIDYDRGSKDDHLILICAFDSAGKLMLAQASVQFHGADDKNFTVAPITSDKAAHGDVAQALYDTMHDQQKKVDYGDDRDNAGRKGYAYVAKSVAQSLTKAVKH